MNDGKFVQMKKLGRVMVTGGAGFIGSHIAKELVNRGYWVTVLDDLSTGKLENIQDLLPKENFEFKEGSITNLALLQKEFSNFEYIFHQAAIPSVVKSIDNPTATHEANITGTLNVLLAAKDNQVKKVVYASSSSVYGDTPVLPKREEMIPNPQSPYALTKLAAEYYCAIFTKVYGLPTTCLRYFNVYGPRQNPNTQYAAVIPTFIKRISEGKPPIIFGDGEQTRDFTFVEDVVSANLLAAESESTGVFNVGRGERISLNNLASLILGRLNAEGVKPVFESGRLGDVKHSLADITRAATFGYQPKYSIEQGIIKTIRSFKNGL